LEVRRKKKRREVGRRREREHKVGVRVRKPLDAEAESGWRMEGKNQLRSVWLARRGEFTHLEVAVAIAVS